MIAISILSAIDGGATIIPVAFSLMASFMSAITILGVSMENYTYGTQVCQCTEPYMHHDTSSSAVHDDQHFVCPQHPHSRIHLSPCVLRSPVSQRVQVSSSHMMLADLVNIILILIQYGYSQTQYDTI